MMTPLFRSLFLATLLALFTLPARADTFSAPTGEVILTLKGKLSAQNADGSLLLDQALLETLPQTEFTTTTIWTSGTPTFRGVLLKDLIAAVGATGTTIHLRAVNDYSISMPFAEVGETAPLLAHMMNGETMSLRDKGPVWMVFPYDSGPAFQTEEIYARSIWQLVEITFE